MKKLIALLAVAAVVLFWVKAKKSNNDIFDHGIDADKA